MKMTQTILGIALAFLLCVNAFVNCASPGIAVDLRSTYLPTTKKIRVSWNKPTSVQQGDNRAINQATGQIFSTQPTPATEWKIEFSPVSSNFTTTVPVRSNLFTQTVQSTTEQDITIPTGASSVSIKLDCTGPPTPSDKRLNGFFHFKDSGGNKIYTAPNPSEYCDSSGSAPVINNNIVKSLSGTLAAATTLTLHSYGSSQGAHGPVIFTWQWVTASAQVNSCPNASLGIWGEGATGTGDLSEASFMPDCLMEAGGARLKPDIGISNVQVRVRLKTINSTSWGLPSTPTKTSCRLKSECAVCPKTPHVDENTTSSCTKCPDEGHDRRHLIGGNVIQANGEQSCLLFSECLPSKQCFSDDEIYMVPSIP